MNKTIRLNGLNYDPSDNLGWIGSRNKVFYDPVMHAEYLRTGPQMEAALREIVDLREEMGRLRGLVDEHGSDELKQRVNESLLVVDGAGNLRRVEFIE